MFEVVDACLEIRKRIPLTSAEDIYDNKRLSVLHCRLLYVTLSNYNLLVFAVHMIQDEKLCTVMIASRISSILPTLQASPPLRWTLPASHFWFFVRAD